MSAEELKIERRAQAACARAQHALRAQAALFLDAGIASLERLRRAAAGGDAAGDECENERRGPKEHGPKELRTVNLDTSIPISRKPRRLRRLLVHVCVLLAGGTAGMALAYDLLAQLLDRRAAAISRQEI